MSLSSGVLPPSDAADAAAETDTLSDIDDDEIDGVLLNTSEVQVKSELWHEMNKDYLLKQEEKKRLMDEGAIKEPKKKKRRQAARDGRGKTQEPAETPAEAAIQALSQRKISKKINYQVVEELLNMSDVSFDAPANAAATKVEPMVLNARTRSKAM